MEPGEKKAEPMSMKRIAGTCEHVGVYEAKNVAIYPEGFSQSPLLFFFLPFELSLTHKHFLKVFLFLAFLVVCKL